MPSHDCQILVKGIQIFGDSTHAVHIRGREEGRGGRERKKERQTERERGKMMQNCECDVTREPTIYKNI